METYLAWAFITVINLLFFYFFGYDSSYDKKKPIKTILKGVYRTGCVIISVVAICSMIYLFLLSVKIVTGG